MPELPPPPNDPRRYVSLLPDMVMPEVKTFFEEKTDHRPSDEMLEALRDIPQTVADIIEGKAEKKYYLCPIDTGVGKTVTLAHTIKWLREDAPWKYLDIGSVIGLERMDQIEGMAQQLEALGVKKTEYAVYTGAGNKHNNWGMGKANAGKAPVLLTTHAMIERRIIGKDWDECDEFFYKEKPRLLKIWDESIAPGKTITVGQPRLFGLLSCNVKPAALYNTIHKFVYEVSVAKNGDKVDIPDFADHYELGSAIASIKSSRNELNLTDTLADLWELSGRAARVAYDGKSAKNTLVQYRLDKTDAMLPMLCLDASARVKGSYELQERNQGNIHRLKGSPKSYSNVTFNILPKTRGKTLYGKRYTDTINDVVSLIERFSDKNILVLHPKVGWGLGDIPGDVMAALTAPKGMIAQNREPPKNLVFCNWGKHTATNEYKDSNVIIAATTLFYPESALQATTRLSADRDVEFDVERYEYQIVRRGAMLADFLQAFSRGCMRELEGNEAKACRVFVPLSDRRLVKLLPDVFPGATFLRGWGPDKVKMKKEAIVDKPTREEQVLAFIKGWPGHGTTIYHDEIYTAIGMKQGNFSRLMNTYDMKKALAAAGHTSVRSSPSYIIRNKGDQ